MNRSMYALLLVAALATGCSDGMSRTVDSPPIDVRTALAANESTLALADQLVGASHSAEATDQGIVWHFSVNGQDYARYIITIADKPGGSKVSAAFEAVDGPTNSAVPYLRDTARSVSNETLLATLDHRAINIDTLKRALIVNTVRDPSKVMGLQRAIVADLNNALQDMGTSRAPDQPHGYNRTPAYDRTPTYDRERVTQYEAERRRAELPEHYRDRN